MKNYQHTNNRVKNDEGDLIAESESILLCWGNYFSQSFNEHGFSELWQREIHTPGSLVRETSASELEWLL